MQPDQAMVREDQLPLPIFASSIERSPKRLRLVSASATHVESYVRSSRGLSRVVTRRDGSVSRSLIAMRPGPEAQVPAAEAEREILREQRRPMNRPQGRTIRLLDLFSGCGGLSVGVCDALSSLGYPVEPLGIDLDEPSLCVYAENLPAANTLRADIADRFDGELGTPRTRSERQALAQIGPRDMVVGGPPCQGHSAFNNRTRHDDARNGLYLRLVRAIELLSPNYAIVENVPGALNDRDGVVQTALEYLRQLGYHVAMAVVDASELGVAQRRRRLVVAASRIGAVDLVGAIASYRVPIPRNVRWAMEDLADREADSLIDSPARSAPQTRARIDRLFELGLYDLPNEFRPACHRNGGHSYGSIYGRLRWDEPAQTVTTGFYSMCMGRNVHPSRRRTITAHEAARIQGFPDYFDFGVLDKRVDLARLIGNAVPPKLGYVVALELVR